MVFGQTNSATRGPDDVFFTLTEMELNYLDNKFSFYVRQIATKNNFSSQAEFKITLLNIPCYQSPNNRSLIQNIESIDQNAITCLCEFSDSNIDVLIDVQKMMVFVSRPNILSIVQCLSIIQTIHRQN